MAITSVERQLIELERRYWQAMKDKDVKEALRLTDDPCIVAGASGAARVDHARYVELLKGATWEIGDFSISDVEVTTLTDDVAALAYVVREELTVDGQPVTLNAADSSVWVRHGDSWRCAVHTESVLGDAFGRDRSHARVEE